ncbi:MAG TPA: RNA-binding S4 domain-containing protein [Chitinophagales bacterium]|nr:RNA-binding S4 domain-containing protein [Chitinophagales bacterium]
MEAEKTRIDKWLHAVRLYKTRTLASEACEAGKVKVNDEKVKSAFQIKVGMLMELNKQGVRYKYKVLKIIETRVSAGIAQQCYEDLTPLEEIDKLKFPAFFYEVRDKGVGRPTKKERRDIDKFKGQ